MVSYRRVFLTRFVRMSIRPVIPHRPATFSGCCSKHGLQFEDAMPGVVATLVRRHVAAGANPNPDRTPTLTLTLT